jgi:guanylate kinase
MKNSIFVLSAPSGTGKTTIIKKLKEKLKNTEIVTTYTTRKPRKGEKNGIDYFFVGKEEFERMIKENRFAEWSIVYGNYYGTPEDEIKRILKNKKNVLLVIDTQGGLKIKKKYPEAYLIGILPPSLKEQENRMRKRGDMSEKEIEKRLSKSREEREVLFKHYNCRLINKDIEKTVERLRKIIEG